MTRSIYLRLKFVNDAVDADATLIRWGVVYDRNPRGTAFTVANLFNITTDVLGMIKLDQSIDKGRFNVLHDETVKMFTPNGGGTDIFRKIFIKKNLETLFKSDEAGNGIGAIYKGSLYIYCMPNGNTGNVIMTYAFRMRFVDF